MRQTPIEQRVSDIIEPVITDTGFTLVAVKIQNDSGAQVVQIMAENPKTRNLGVDDCAVISRAVSAVMDVEDPISSAYRLEVSSPGIDRPLVKPEDFDHYKGFEAKLELNMPDQNGQKRFRGVLNGLLEDDKTTLRITTQDQGVVDLPFDALAKAKLVLTDDLIKASAELAANDTEKA